MRQLFLCILTIASGFILMLFSCRTEIPLIAHSRNSPPPELLESAKLWYAQHIDTKAPKIKKYGVLPVYWKDAWIKKTADSNTIIVVPAKDYFIENTDFTFKRFVIFKVSAKRATKGEIIELVGKNYNVNNNTDFLLKNYNQDTIPGFNGAVLQYDVSYRQIKGIAYKQGYRDKNKKVGIVYTSGAQINKLLKQQKEKDAK